MLSCRDCQVLGGRLGFVLSSEGPACCGFAAWDFDVALFLDFAMVKPVALDLD